VLSIIDKLMIALGLWPRYSILNSIFIKSLFCQQEQRGMIVEEFFYKEDIAPHN